MIKKAAGYSGGFFFFSRFRVHFIPSNYVICTVNLYT